MQTNQQIPGQREPSKNPYMDPPTRFGNRNSSLTHTQSYPSLPAPSLNRFLLPSAPGATTVPRASGGGCSGGGPRQRDPSPCPSNQQGSSTSTNRPSDLRSIFQATGSQSNGALSGRTERIITSASLARSRQWLQIGPITVVPLGPTVRSMYNASVKLPWHPTSCPL